MRSCRAVGGSVVGGWQHLGLKTNFEKRNHRGSSMSGATRCRLLIHFSNGWRKSFFCVLQHLGQQNNLAFCPKCRKLQQEMVHKSKIIFISGQSRISIEVTMPLMAESRCNWLC